MRAYVKNCCILGLEIPKSVRHMRTYLGDRLIAQRRSTCPSLKGDFRHKMPQTAKKFKTRRCEGNGRCQVESVNTAILQ